jgi:hypothetical protein
MKNAVAPAVKREAAAGGTSAPLTLLIPQLSLTHRALDIHRRSNIHVAPAFIAVFFRPSLPPLHA